MTRKEVIVKAIDGQLNWIQAADILGMTPRHLQRLKRAWERATTPSRTSRAARRGAGGSPSR